MSNPQEGPRAGQEQKPKVPPGGVDPSRKDFKKDNEWKKADDQKGAKDKDDTGACGTGMCS